MIILAFVLGFTSLAYAGHSGSGKRQSAQAALQFNFKKSWHQGITSHTQNQDRTVFFNLRTRTFLSISAFPAIRENCSVPEIDRANGAVISVAEATRLRCDHLLHLFPSHYFW